mmetsp:Transcript_4431/g.11101  ORF Transcript_4431/g.11101 Transcript_4431/m.11101 type:complete len:214 (-) Transcript_4431:626-1267(-)
MVQNIAVRDKESVDPLLPQGRGGVKHVVVALRVESKPRRERRRVRRCENAHSPPINAVDVLDVSRSLELRQLVNDLPPEKPKADETEEHPESTNEPPRTRDRHLVPIPNRCNGHHRKPQPIHNALGVELAEVVLVGVPLEEPEQMAHSEHKEEKDGNKVDERSGAEHVPHGQLVGQHVGSGPNHDNKPVIRPEALSARVFIHVDHIVLRSRVA